MHELNFKNISLILNFSDLILPDLQQLTSDDATCHR